MDLFVANDTVANFLFMNRVGGRFEEIGEPAGVAYSTEGRPRSGMGVDSADFNQDGWMDLFVANIDMERYAIYHNNHDETFDDQAGRTGIGQATRLMSGWGLKLFAYDDDGELAVFLATGTPGHLIDSVHPQGRYAPRLVLGIGQRKKVDWVEVKWPLPSGAVERFTDLPIDRYITIVEGEGK